MNLAFLPLFTPFMSAGPGSLVGLFECVHFGRRWKESGEHGILNHLMRGDRQRFCPACSGAASSQRPLTGSDTSLRCRTWECMWVCVCVGASPALLQPGWLRHSYNFCPTSQHLVAFPHQLGMFIWSRHISRLWSAYLCAWWGLSGRLREAARCVRRQCRGRGRSLRVFGLGLQLACADWAGAWRENPEREINKQVAAEFHVLVFVPYLSLEVPDTHLCWANELNTQVC